MTECLPRSFFDRPTLEVAPQLLGQVLVRRLAGEVYESEIVEVEAYTSDDPACHAYGGRKKRCEVMFGPAGYAYVYFIYGMYHCLNVVTEGDGVPGAVLIRAVSPLSGLEHTRTNGPGKPCKTLAIDLALNGQPLFARGELYIAAAKPDLKPLRVIATPRIGISKAQERLWRFCWQDHPALSRRS